MPGKEGDNFPRLTPEQEVELFESIDNVLNLSMMIDRLDEEKLGVKITFAYPDDPPLHNEEVRTAGYVLPLSANNNKHLVIFKNRDMLVIEPKLDSEYTNEQNLAI